MLRRTLRAPVLFAAAAFLGVLEAARDLEMVLKDIDDAATAGLGGHWAVIRKDPATGQLQGARSSSQNEAVIEN